LITTVDTLLLRISLIDGGHRYRVLRLQTLGTVNKANLSAEVRGLAVSEIAVCACFTFRTVLNQRRTLPT
jgi:hypothetical protein